MYPTVSQNSRVILEKVSSMKGRPCSRGDIIVFYPPSEETGYHLKWDVPHIAGRLVGFSIFPNSVVFIARVIGLPGDRIEVNVDGVYINDKLINEDKYVLDKASYKISKLSDLGKGRATMKYQGKNSPIVVPPDKIFVLGDVRNNSNDSSNFGFVDKSNIVGRLWIQLTPHLEIYRLPIYSDN